MSRNYQAKRNNPYYIDDEDMRMQVFYMIRRYPNLKAQRDKLLYGSPPLPDGQPRGNNTGNPTEQKALKLCVIDEQLRAIEQTIVELNAQYNQTYTGEAFDAYEAFKDYGVFCWYRSKPSRDKAPCRKTWSRFRAKFIYEVAKKLNYL